MSVWVKSPQADIALVGYSGGGVIALLVAAQLPQVSTVITVASPLDIEAWTQLHAYTPLSQSVSPLDLQSWPAELRQLHLTGTEDQNVPPSLSHRLQQKLEAMGVNAEFRTQAGYDHRCCWAETWAERIRLLSQQQFFQRPGGMGDDCLP